MEERGVLWNILQKYLYEMTKYYSDDMDENGNYHYRYFDAYFSEPERIAYFIYNDNRLVGFTMINSYSYLDHHPDHVIAEFTVFPSCRGRHFAINAAQVLLNMLPGRWEIKFNENNMEAKKLWESLTKPYSPCVYHLNDKETVLEFAN